MKTFILFAGLLAIGSGTAMAQGTQSDRDKIHNDMIREKQRKDAIGKDIITGHPERVKADHQAAAHYHNKVNSDIHRMQDHDVKRARVAHKSPPKHPPVPPHPPLPPHPAPPVVRH